MTLNELRLLESIVNEHQELFDRIKFTDLSAVLSTRGEDLKMAKFVIEREIKMKPRIFAKDRKDG